MRRPAEARRRLLLAHAQAEQVERAPAAPAANAVAAAGGGALVWGAAAPVLIDAGLTLAQGDPERRGELGRFAAWVVAVGEAADEDADVVEPRRPAPASSGRVCELGAAGGEPARQVVDD